MRKLAVIRVTDVRRERLDAMLVDKADGFAETTTEGFGADVFLREPSVFIGMFCGVNRCQQWDDVTRIEFEYVDEPEREAVTS